MDSENFMLNSYLALLVFMLIIASFVAFSLLANYLLEPSNKSNPVALDDSFECGSTPFQKENTTQVHISYYKVAVVFLLFDLEAIFLYMWSQAAQPLNNFMMFTFVLFMLVLLILFFYVLSQGILDFAQNTKNRKEY